MPLPHVIANLLYPPACLLCHAPLAQPPAVEASRATDLLCQGCVEAMPHRQPPVCTRCGLGLRGAFDVVVQCARCRTTPPAFEMARAPWRYAGPVQAAIRQFKYHRRWRLGRWLAEEMARTAQSSFPLEEIAVILPVPLHWVKRWLRGTNPSEALATSVSRTLGKPCLAHALRRSRWTATQTRLGWRARFRNVQRAFVADNRLVRGRSVLLVDDVLTSGATANACADALKRAGARRVFVLTAARTPFNDR